jgi:hypothetical protein
MLLNIHDNEKVVRSRDNSAVCGMDDGGARVPAGVGNFTLHHRVQTDCVAYPASYPMDTGGGGLFPWG